MTTLPARIVMASGNPGKLREIARLLEDLGIEVVPQSEYGVSDADETGTTFAENALIKARHAAATTGLPAIADDSGLVVDALDGRPGVYSARYAGSDATDQQNNLKLLAELQQVDDADRGAAFHCTACFVMPDDSEPLLATGEWRGSILREQRGTGGFGYDPLFLDPASGKTAAELTAAEKNARSHRGKALRRLGRLLHERWP
jgi:XTP/dITP diphosphohydrolase